MVECKGICSIELSSEIMGQKMCLRKGMIGGLYQPAHTPALS